MNQLKYRTEKFNITEINRTEHQLFQWSQSIILPFKIYFQLHVWQCFNYVFFNIVLVVLIKVCVKRHFLTLIYLDEDQALALVPE